MQRQYQDPDSKTVYGTEAKAMQLLQLALEHWSESITPDLEVSFARCDIKLKRYRINIPRGLEVSGIVRIGRVAVRFRTAFSYYDLESCCQSFKLEGIVLSLIDSEESVKTTLQEIQFHWPSHFCRCLVVDMNATNAQLLSEAIKARM